MNLINNFDIFSDFYADPQLRLLFSEEYNTVPSNIMWALLLYTHPDSKYSSQSDSTKQTLIEKDYLKSALDWASYSHTIDKILSYLLTKSQRLLSQWERKLEERDAFIHSLPYNEDTYEMLDKMMANTAKMWEQYLSILKKASQEVDSQTQGDLELSLSQKGII